MSDTPPTDPRSTDLSGAAFPSHRAPPPKRRPAWRTALWIGVAILIALAAAWMLTPHGGKTKGHGGGFGARGPGGSRAPTVVGATTAVRGDIPIVLSALGTVTSEATVTVTTQISGALMKIDFKEGQTVHKGEQLAEVDMRPYQVALTQAEGQLARDQASLNNARLDLKRYQTLAAQDSISGQQVDTQAALVKQDEGVVKTDQAAVASAKLNLAYCHIVAPISGRVGLRQVDAGNYITAGSSTGVVVITQFDPIDVVFSLPEDNVPQVAARTSQGATLTVTALDRTGATTLAHGVLATLDNQIDTATGTIKAKARFGNPDGTLFPNQFVNVQLLVDTLKGVVVVPTAAVRHGSGGDYVFVLDQDPLTGGSVARMVNVKVGPGQGDSTSIASGVAVGDQVITDGGDRLTDGGAVLLPGQIPSSFNRQPKPTGLFGWLSGLVGHKPAASGGEGAAFGGSNASGAEVAGSAGGAPGGGHGGGGARMQAMLAQLDLTPDQKSKVAAIMAATRQKIHAAGDDPDARRTAMHDSMTQIGALLTPEQKAKLVQLRASAGAGGANGAAPPAGRAGGDTSSAAPPATTSPKEQPPSATPSATSDAAPAPAAPPNGGRRLGGGHGALFAVLDDDQKAKARAIIEAARASGDPDAFQNARAQIAALLRPDQKAKLEEMRAAPAAGGGDQ